MSAGAGARGADTTWASSEPVLVEMDGLKGMKGVVIAAALTVRDVLGPALLRQVVLTVKF